jgi:formate dehydrogenase major subunit
MNGQVLVDVPDPNDPTKLLLQAGKQIAGFGALRDDGSTSAGCWIHAGWLSPRQATLTARRDNKDPGDGGMYSNWAFSWPANRRILYNRASADLQGKAWIRRASSSNGTARNGPASTRRDIAPTAKPETVGPFIMNQGGCRQVVGARRHARRTLPGPLRAVREPAGQSGRRTDFAAIRWRACSRPTWRSLATRRSFPMRRRATA